MKEKTLIELVLAYPFKVLNRKEIDIKKFIFTLSLDNGVCMPSATLRILKYGIEKGFLKVDKGKVEATFDFNKYKIPANLILSNNDIKKYNLPEATWSDFGIYITTTTEAKNKRNKKRENISSIEKKEEVTESIEEEKGEEKKVQKENKRKKKRKKDAGMNTLSDYF